MKDLSSFPAGIADMWTAFLAQDSNPPGRDVYPDIFSNGLLFPLQRMRETEKMIAMGRTVIPKVVMEIGSDKGGSFYHWVKAFSPKKALALEIRGIPFEDSFPGAFPKTQFFFAGESSYAPATVKAVKSFLGSDLIDCLFIDGDKSAFDRDVGSYLPMVRKGGLIFLHDVSEVLNAQETMKLYASKGYRTETIIDTSEYDDILKRAQAGIPPASAYEGWFRVWKRSSCAVGVIHA